MQSLVTQAPWIPASSSRSAAMKLSRSSQLVPNKSYLGWAAIVAKRFSTHLSIQRARVCIQLGAGIVFSFLSFLLSLSLFLFLSLSLCDGSLNIGETLLIVQKFITHLRAEGVGKKSNTCRINYQWKRHLQLAASIQTVKTYTWHSYDVLPQSLWYTIHT